LIQAGIVTQSSDLLRLESILSKQQSKLKNQADDDVKVVGDVDVMSVSNEMSKPKPKKKKKTKQQNDANNDENDDNNHNADNNNNNNNNNSDNNSGIQMLKEREGWGDKSVENLLASINEIKSQSIAPHRLLYSLGHWVIGPLLYLLLFNYSLSLI
jgi:hypothetical protein